MLETKFRSNKSTSLEGTSTRRKRILQDGDGAQGRKRRDLTLEKRRVWSRLLGYLKRYKQNVYKMMYMDLIHK